MMTEINNLSEKLELIARQIDKTAHGEIVESAQAFYAATVMAIDLIA